MVDFVIHWNETAKGLHVFPIPIPLPLLSYTHFMFQLTSLWRTRDTSLSIPLLMSCNTCPPYLTIIPSHPCPCFKIQLKWFLIQVMPNQRWVCPPARRKNVPTLGFVEAKYSVYCKENGQLMFKRPKLPQAFQGRYFKGKVEKKKT